MHIHDDNFLREFFFPFSTLLDYMLSTGLE